MDNRQRQTLAAIVPSLSGSAVVASIAFRGHRPFEVICGWVAVTAFVLIASALIIELKRSKKRQ